MAPFRAVAERAVVAVAVCQTIHAGFGGFVAHLGGTWIHAGPAGKVHARLGPVAEVAVVTIKIAGTVFKRIDRVGNAIVVRAGPIGQQDRQILFVDLAVAV